MSDVSSDSHLSTSENTAVKSQSSDITDSFSNRSRAPVEKIKMPFRVLFIDDLTPGCTRENGANLSRTWSVDGNTFATKLEELAPSISFEVENGIGDTPSFFEINLTITTLNDFQPDAVVDAVPVLQTLKHIRDAVLRVEGGDNDLTAFQAALHKYDIETAWTQNLHEWLSGTCGSVSSSDAPERLNGADSLGRLLDMVDTSGTSTDTLSMGFKRRRSTETDRAASALGAFIQSAKSGSSISSKVDQSAVKALSDRLHDLIWLQLNAIYENESMAKLERAWRSLKVLVDRFDTRSGIMLDVLACPVDDLAKATYEQVLMPEHNRTDGAALSMIVCGTTFERSPTDVKRMRDLAETGLSLQTPVLASVDHRFFGVDRVEDLSDLPLLWQQLDSPAYTGWAKLRSEDAAAFLTLCVPPFVLRAERNREKHTVQRPLYGPGAVMLATTIAESYSRTGWPTHISDSRSKPMQECAIVTTEHTPSPLATLIPARKQSELSDAGFAVLDACDTKGAVLVRHAPTVKEPSTYQTAAARAEARAHAALTCRMFVSRSAHFVLHLQDNVPEDLELDDARAWLKGQLMSFLCQGDVEEVPDECICVDSVDSAKLSGTTLFAIRIAPPETIVDLEHQISLVLGFKVPDNLRKDANDADGAQDTAKG